MSLVTVPLWAVLLAAASEPTTSKPFEIQVVDQETGRGVALVELKTVNNIRLYTDSNGIVAFFEPGLMNRKVFFHVAGHGYEFPTDGFGFRGKTLTVTPGGHAKLEINRVNIAQRLYRITGAGIYSDSLLTGRHVPIRQPLLNGLVFGSDSVMSTVYGGKIYWFWGDTNRPGYPLGNFKVPGATSLLPDSEGLDPDVGVDLSYFLDDNGFAKKTIAASDPGPTWISGLIVLCDGQGKERMFAHYANIQKPMETYERGLVEFDQRAEQFDKVATFPLDGPFPHGAQALVHTVDAVPYVYFCDPYPQVRVQADEQHLKKPQTYEAFTCLEPGSRLSENRLDRDDDGSLRWAWKPNTDVLGPKEQAKLIRDGQLQPGESPWALSDVETGKPIIAHRGSVAFNAYRGRWVMIAGEVFGTSMLGETWYAEADRLTGPWIHARKIVTHDNYSFYNPTQHSMLDKDGGRTIYFEGTYTHTFSGNPDQTPRYDYNQIMYKLDLTNPRLHLP